MLSTVVSLCALAYFPNPDISVTRGKTFLKPLKKPLKSRNLPTFLPSTHDSLVLIEYSLI